MVFQHPQTLIKIMGRMTIITKPKPHGYHWQQTLHFKEFQNIGGVGKSPINVKITNAQENLCQNSF
jgi:hypothetical protein